MGKVDLSKKSPKDWTQITAIKKKSPNVDKKVAQKLTGQFSPDKYPLFNNWPTTLEFSAKDIVATGFKKSTKQQWIAQSGPLLST